MNCTSVTLFVTRIQRCIFACLQTDPKQNYGTIGEFTLILHGTEQIPANRRNGPRIYDDYNRKTVSSAVTQSEFYYTLNSLH